MLVFHVLITVATLHAGGLLQQAEQRRLQLSSLNARCTLRLEWVGVVQALPEGVFLTCGVNRFLVLMPANMFGHVRISDQRAALEFVRLFTRKDTYRLFTLGGRIEILPSSAPKEQRGPNEVSVDVFNAHFRPPQVNRVKGSREALYTVERYVVAPGNKVYRIRESVTERGYYAVEQEELVASDGSVFGLLHVG